MKNWFTLLLIAAPLSVAAEITLDGSVGIPEPINGPHYQIEPRHGQINDSNLFHSFADFSLKTGESATFNGPPHIQHIISRVTGGNVSNIDGIIRSTIPGADFYLINPFGMVFGEHATLNVLGSFYASTADTLHFDNGEMFSSNLSAQSVFSTATPAAFGFLGETVSTGITVNGRSAPVDIPGNPGGSTLEVHGGEKLSFIAEHIEINHTQLRTRGGEIHLETLGNNAGKVPINGLSENRAPLAGEIRITDNSINTSHPSLRSRVFIRGGELTIDNALINTSVVSLPGPTSPSNPQLANELPAPLTRGETRATNSAEGIELVANNIRLNNHVVLRSVSENGQAGGITLAASQDLTLDHGDDGVMPIEVTSALDVGITGTTSIERNNNFDSGNITLKAGEDLSINSARLVASTQTRGNSGNITLEAGGNITIGGLHSDTLGELRGPLVDTSTNGIGNAGNISMTAQSILLQDGLQVLAEAFGEGQGGNIEITATAQLTLEGSNPSQNPAIRSPTQLSAGSGLNPDIPRQITPSSDTPTGKGGEIFIETPELRLLEGARIDASSFALNGPPSGDGGTITINADDILISGRATPLDNAPNLLLSGIYAESLGTDAGRAGTIMLTANNLTLENSGVISSRISSPTDSLKDPDTMLGSGDILLTIRDTLLIDGTPPPDEFDLENLPETLPEAASIIASSSNLRAGENGERGNSGNIIINAGTLTVLNTGSISTKTAGVGDAGNITINAENINIINDLKFHDDFDGKDESLISSASESTDVYPIQDPPNEEPSALLFASESDRNGETLIIGDRVRIQSPDTPRASLSFYDGESLIRIPAEFRFNSVAELISSDNQFDFRLGDVALVGERVFFRVTATSMSLNNALSSPWVEIGNVDDAIMSAQTNIGLLPIEVIPDEASLATRLPVNTSIEGINRDDLGGGESLLSGQVVLVTLDSGEQALFAVTINPNDEGRMIDSPLQVSRLQQFIIEEASELNLLEETLSLETGSIAILLGDGLEPAARFVYSDGWIPFNNQSEKLFSSIDEQSELIQLRPGDISLIDDGSNNIQAQSYSGDIDIPWLPLNSNSIINIDTLPGIASDTPLNELLSQTMLPDAALDTLEPGSIVNFGNGESLLFLGMSDAGQPRWVERPIIGGAGHVDIQATEIFASGKSEIATEAFSVNGGNIAIDTNTLRLFEGAKFDASIQGDRAAQEKLNSQGLRDILETLAKVQVELNEDPADTEAGKITISANRFVLMRAATVEAGAITQTGGEINITTPAFARSTNTVVDASSQFGLDGDENIDVSSLLDIAALLSLRTEFNDAEFRLDYDCDATLLSDESRLVNALTPPGRPRLPEDWQ